MHHVPYSHYLLFKCEDSVTAALTAGYGKAYAQAAASCVGKAPSVAKAIENIRQKGREMAAYDLSRAMQEAQEMIDFAKGTKNAMAYYKAVSLRAELSGLLIQQLHIKQEVIDLRSALQEARTRVINPTLALSQRATVVDPFEKAPEDAQPQTST
jgi:hypothetical protein